MFIPRLRFKSLTNMADKDKEHILRFRHLCLSNTIRANMRQRFIKQVAVYYLLNTDIRFTFPIKYQFVDFVLHLLLKTASKLRNELHLVLPSNSVFPHFLQKQSIMSNMCTLLKRSTNYRIHYYPQQPAYCFPTLHVKQHKTVELLVKYN